MNCVNCGKPIRPATQEELDRLGSIYPELERYKHINANISTGLWTCGIGYGSNCARAPVETIWKDVMTCINCGLEIVVCPGKDNMGHLYHNNDCVGYKHKTSGSSWDLWHGCRIAMVHAGLTPTIPTYDIYNKEVNARPDVKQTFIVEPKNQKSVVIIQDIIEIVEIPTRRKFKNIS
jgi:hypothetical protein